MSTYSPQAGPSVARPTCANCGAAYRLHHADVNDTGEQYVLRCPVAYRPDSLEAAERALADASGLGDPGRIFLARGEVQRLLEHRPGTCLPLCSACELLLATAVPGS